jgi:hypothetical protein
VRDSLYKYVNPFRDIAIEARGARAIVDSIGVAVRGDIKVRVLYLRITSNIRVILVSLDF